MIAHSLVDAFIVACEDNQIALQRELVGHVLVEALPIRRGEDDLVVVAFRLQGCDTAVDRLTLHHHTSAAAVWIVIYPAPLVKGVVTQVVQTDLRQTFLLCPCQD